MLTSGRRFLRELLECEHVRDLVARLRSRLHHAIWGE